MMWGRKEVNCVGMRGRGGEREGKKQGRERERVKRESERETDRQKEREREMKQSEVILSFQHTFFLSFFFTHKELLNYNTKKQRNISLLKMNLCCKSQPNKKVQTATTEITTQVHSNTRERQKGKEGGRERERE